MLSLLRSPGVDFAFVLTFVGAGMFRGSVDELKEESTVLMVTAVEGSGLTTEENDGATEDSTFSLSFMTS
jgi:hypothetical protein